MADVRRDGAGLCQPVRHGSEGAARRFGFWQVE